MMGPFLKPVSARVSRVHVSMWYAGQRLIDGRQGIELRVSFALPAGRNQRFHVRGQSEVVTVDRLEGEMVRYMDPSSRFVLRDHSTTTLGMRLKNQSLTAKIISASSLDLDASKGI